MDTVLRSAAVYIFLLVIFRISGKRYPVTLAKVDDAAVVATVRDVAFKKYPARPGGEVWLFAVTSRPPDAGR